MVIVTAYLKLSPFLCLVICFALFSLKLCYALVVWVMLGSKEQSRVLGVMGVTHVMSHKSGSQCES